MRFVWSDECRPQRKQSSANLSEEIILYWQNQRVKRKICFCFVVVGCGDDGVQSQP